MMEPRRELVCIDWKELPRWKTVVGPRQSTVLNPHFVPGKLASFGFELYYKPELAARDGKVQLWVPVDHLNRFARHILQATGIRLSAFPDQEFVVDIRDFTKVKLTHPDQLKEIQREADHAHYIAGTTQLLQETRDAFQFARRYLALDFETYEHDQRIVTEFGMTKLDTYNDGVVKTRHLIVEEYVNYRNGAFVPDCKDRFRHGPSLTMPLQACIAQLADALAWAEALVFHDAGADIQIMENRLGLRVDRKMPCYDTKVLFGAKEKSRKGESLGLGRMAQALGVQNTNLHNAGNDSHATMESFLVLMQPDLPRAEPGRRGPPLVLAFESDEDDFEYY